MAVRHWCAARFLAFDAACRWSGSESIWLVSLLRRSAQADWLFSLGDSMLRAFRSAAVLSAALVCAMPALAAVSAEVRFHNPLVLQRADPQVSLQPDGYYYFTATVPEYDRIEIRRARSLDDLAKGQTKVVWTKHAKGEMGAHIWAPEMHRIDGKWYIYFTAGRAEDKWAIRLYVLENASADPFEGEWVERGQLKTGWESFSLDATTFALDGKRYLVWTQVAPGDKKGTNIYLARMDSPTSIAGPATLITKPEYPWEKVKYDVNEGPAVLVKNGRVFITYSASATDANYCMGMVTARADADLLDARSWTKSPEPVFKSSDRNGQWGPGHNAFTTTPDGKTDVLVYHARNYREIQGDSLHDPNRNTRAQVIRWRPDGTPDFGEPVADAPKQ
jgi:GH43 family beta-xylosidase